MPSSAPIPDTAQALINWSIHGLPAQNQVFFRALSPPVTQAKLDTLLARLVVGMQFNFAAGLGVGTVLRNIECIDRSPGSTLVSSQLINMVVPGAIEALPISIALALKHWVASPLEVHPSLTFVPGIPENRVTGNLLNTVWADGIAGLWATNMAILGSFGWRYCKVSLFSGGAARPVGVTSDISGTVVLGYRVSQQRRRQTA